MSAAVTDGRHLVEFDHHNAEFRDDNKAVIRRLHASGSPLGWTNAHDGFWAIYGYDAIFDAVQDADLFSSAHTAAVPKGVPSGGDRVPFIPIDFDGELVTDYRKVLLERMSPSAAKEDKPRLEEICTELIDSFIERGSCDLSQELLTPLPARWILEKLGWQPERWPEWIEWIHSSIHDRTEDPARSDEAVANIYQNIIAELNARRDTPGDDLFSLILASTPGGQSLNEEQVVGFSQLLLLGGMDTTAGLTGNVIEVLNERPDLRDQLIEHPDLLRGATEEFLRYASPSYGLYRTITRDALFHGQQILKGERAMLMFPAAGLDPSAFKDPETIDFKRTRNRHMAFGLGPHRCLGSHHARIMFQIMLTQIFERMPDFQVSGKIVRFEDSGDVWAIRNLPIRFTPGRRSTNH
jgi:cytochrome P450